ncbi:MAG TPA: hypothetical protein VNN72_20275 [Polyangiaceae bacterium]|nr:hypothetical protein [Polyangiaceae bacterium]
MRSLAILLTVSLTLPTRIALAQDPIPTPTATPASPPPSSTAAGAASTTADPSAAAPALAAPAPVLPAQVPASPAPAPPAAPAAPRQLPPNYSFVHLGSNYSRAQLELKSSIDEAEWRAVCLAPCDIPVPVAGALARVTAPGMTSSNSFRIEPGSGTALVRADGGSAQARSLGITGLFVGIPTAIAGMALFGYGKLNDQDGARITGTVVLATGGVILVASLPLLLIGSTKVRDARGTVIAETLRTGTARF